MAKRLDGGWWTKGEITKSVEYGISCGMPYENRGHRCGKEQAIIEDR